MFTGIVQTTGHVAAREDQSGGDARFRIASEALDLERAGLGDSIAVNGVCLTATRFESDGFWADVSSETLSCTTLAGLDVGANVNLESALRVGDPLGGHLVSGHVDGVGELTEMHEDARSWRMRFRFPADLGQFIAAKGSICIDGISLTVNDVTARDFGVNIVPHTFEVTTLGAKAPGAKVNLEIDQLARYLERMLEVRGMTGAGG